MTQNSPRLGGGRGHSVEGGAHEEGEARQLDDDGRLAPRLAARRRSGVVVVGPGSAAAIATIVEDLERRDAVRVARAIIHAPLQRGVQPPGPAPALGVVCPAALDLIW